MGNIWDYVEKELGYKIMFMQFFIYIQAKINYWISIYYNV